MLNNLIRNLAPPLSIEGGEEEGDGGYRKLYQGRSVTIEVGKQEAVAAAATSPPPLFSACNSVNSVVRIDTHTQCRAQSEGEHKGAGFKGEGLKGVRFSMYSQQLYRCQQFSLDLNTLNKNESGQTIQQRAKQRTRRRGTKKV